MRKLVKDYVKFKLPDIPINEFSVLLHSDKQRELIEGVRTTFGGWGSYVKLSKYLITTCKSLRHVSWESINDRYIPLWKSGKRFIPIDVLLEICKLQNIDFNTIKDTILKIKDNTGRDKNAVKFNFTYDKALAGLGELIKCEGHIKKNLTQLSFSNESVDLLSHFKELLNNFGVIKNIDEDLAIEVSIPENEKVIEVDDGTRRLKFWVRINKSNKPKLCFVDNFSYGTKKSYRIVTGNRTIEVTVDIPFESKIITKSNYSTAGATIQVTVTNITICKILHILTGVPTGKKSKIIRICHLNKISPEDVRKEIVNVIMASESWLEPNRIRIYSDSSGYINDLYMLFKSFGIKPNITRDSNSLSINKWSDLEKFSKTFDFIIKAKNEKLETFLSNRKTFKHGEGLLETIQFIKMNKLVTVKDVSKHLNKHIDTAWSHLNKGVENGLIEKHDEYWPYRFSLLEEGEVYDKR